MSNVLVVEDSRTQRYMVTNLLAASEFKVTAAKDGIEALEQIRQACPDLVILDVVMPHLNGYEVCRRLKSNPATKNVAVVMCSLKCTNVDRYWAFKQGADAYIGKPFQPSELINTVKLLLR
jgi:twitching motility two-component system response regulator PilH